MPKFSKKRQFQIGSMQKSGKFLGNLRCMGHDKIYWKSMGQKYRYLQQMGRGLFFLEKPISKYFN